MSQPTLAPRQPNRAPLVGRDTDLAQLFETIRAVLNGDQSVVVVTGEPGVGKTRLIAELDARSSAELGTRSINGFALETGGMPAYFPLARALRHVVPRLAADDPASVRPASVLAAAGLIPPDFEGFAAPPPLAAEAERWRLLDACAESCRRLALRQPLLLTLDDLQWADSGTWDMLVYLARSTESAPLSIVVACRDEALVQGATASHALAELNRLRLLVHHPLRRLAAQDVRRLAEGVLGGPVGDDLAASLAQRSEGNPFFAEELLRGFQDTMTRDWSGAFRIRPDHVPAAPATLTLTIRYRLDALPVQTLATLKAGAVLGRVFGASVVARMLDVAADQVEAWLVPAIVAGAMSGGPGEYQFAHDTVRETAYGLTAGERRQLHHAAARALQEQGPHDFQDLAALAHHWLQTDDAQAAATACAAAARAATGARAYSDALHYARLAVEMLARTTAVSDQAGGLTHARLELAEAALATGEYAEADQVFRQVLATAEQGSDRSLEGRVCARLGVLLRRRERPEEAAAWLRKALALLEQHGDIGEMAVVLMELAGLEGVTLANYQRAEAFGERALALAETADDTRLRAAAALALASVRTRSQDPAAGRPLLQHALDLALQADDAVLAAETCAVLANSHYWSAEMRKSEDYARRRLALAERAGDLFGMRHAHSWLAIVLIAFGRWPEARDLLERSAVILSRLDSPEPVAFVRYLQALIDFQHGRYDEAYVQLTEAMSQFHPATLLWYRGIQARAALELGRAAETLRLVDLLEAELREQPTSALPARSARTVLGLIYAQLGDGERGAACERALRQFADDFHWLLARRSLASLAALRGDTDQAQRDLALAETRARQDSLQPELALVLLRRAELLGPSRPAGRAALSEARELLTALDMRGDLARADALVPPTASPVGLTARELEVLRLIAQGRTNREIADELVVSERTVINHVSHILNKMGVDNRTTAAAWALRQGIA